MADLPQGGNLGGMQVEGLALSAVQPGGSVRSLTVLATVRGRGARQAIRARRTESGHQYHNIVNKLT